MEFTMMPIRIFYETWTLQMKWKSEYPKEKKVICESCITTEELTVVDLPNQSAPQEEPKREIQQNANAHPCSIEIKWV
jgi:hypothetical protein